jgi:hypothetical protein
VSKRSLTGSEQDFSYDLSTQFDGNALLVRKQTVHRGNRLYRRLRALYPPTDAMEKGLVTRVWHELTNHERRGPEICDKLTHRMRNVPNSTTNHSRAAKVCYNTRWVKVN